jgi:5-carboxymethyl-2-hydroxymuconate isomerase
MPHIIVEYSGNLDGVIELDRLLGDVHAAALATGVFPLGGLRTRAARRDAYRIADGAAESGFIHLQLRIGHGRPPEVRQQAAERVFAAVVAATAEVFATRPLGLSLEVVEIDPVGSLKHNNLHDYVARRAAIEVS